MATFTASVPKFSITFILGTTNTITLTDLLQDYTAYGTTVKAVFEITDPDGLLFYQNVGFGSEPPSFTSPDFSSADGTWAVTGITPYLGVDGLSIKRGTYTINAWYKIDSGTPVQIIKTYNLDYVSPVVDISMTAACRTSELTVADNTDYDTIGDSVPLTTSISGSCAVTKPAGSSANSPSTTTFTTSGYSRTIGGGDTAATQLWTRIWQTNITTALVYEMEEWGAYVWVLINDTVYGDDHLDVQCTDCACVLNTCWENLIIRWKDAEANHTVNVHDLRYKIALGAALWTDFYNLERCGEDTTVKCLEIRDLLNSVDCSCVGDTDTKSAVIVPWGSSVTTTVSGPTITFRTTDPSSGFGASGDVVYQTTTKHIWNNASGTWIDNGSYVGGDGAAGDDAVPETTFYNNTGNTGTSAGTTLELLDSIALSSPIVYTTGDEIYVKAVFELALNDNGKTCSLYINATKIVDYFCDTIINATNNHLTMEMWINCTGTDTQSIETLVTRGGNTYPGYTTGTFDTSAGLTINAYGQNSVATLNDIICRVLKVKYNNQIALS